MRIGYLIHDFPADLGGGHVIQATLKEAIDTSKSSHNFQQVELDGDLSARGEESTKLKAKLEAAIKTLGLDMAWFLSPIAKSVSAPFVATVWDLQHRLQPWFPEVSVGGWPWQRREENYRATLPRASRVVTGTQVGKEEIVRFYGVDPENIRVISNPIPNFVRRMTRPDPAIIRAKYCLPERFLFYPAQFWPHKNHINLLLALERLRHEAFVISLVFTGSDQGNRPFVEELVRQKNLAEQVHIIGLVPQEDLIALYLAAAALVSPSYFGPDNLPPLEAFALGCPVIASRIPGAQEQLGEAAVLFNPSNPREIADAIKSVCETSFGGEHRRQTLIRNGLERAAGRSAEAYMQAICQMLNEFEPLRRCWPGQHPPT